MIDQHDTTLINLAGVDLDDDQFRWQRIRRARRADIEGELAGFKGDGGRDRYGLLARIPVVKGAVSYVSPLMPPP